MSTPQGRAHGLSLPLFALMQGLEDYSLQEATNRLAAALQRLLLTKDVNLILLIEDGELAIDLEPLSDFGKMVLMELKSRDVFVACPEGECEYGPDTTCRWCSSPAPTPGSSN